MSEISFEIFRDDIENDPKKHFFSETEPYGTKKFSDGNLVFTGNISAYDIKNKNTEVSISEYEKWYDAVIFFLDKQNDSKENGFTKTIKFEILGVDLRNAYQFKEYIDGKLFKEGNGWLKDLTSEAEKEEWREAVIEYKKANGITSSTDTLKNGVSDFKSAVSKLDSELPSEFDMKPPLIETAIPTLGTDTCNFANNVIKSAEVSISRINGIPSPVELANYYIKLGKDNLASKSTTTANAQKETIEIVATPVTDTYDDTYEYFRQLDAEREEYLKTHSDDVYLFETCVYEEIKYDYGGSMEDFINVSPANPIEIKSEDYQQILNESSTSNVILFKDVANTGKTTTATRTKSVTFNGVTYTAVAGHTYTNTAPPSEIAQNIIMSIRNCFIPLRLAWEEYCKKNGLGAGGWIITSGYRSPIYNAAIGGAANSAHSYGYAIDVQPVNRKTSELGDFIFSFCKNPRNGVTFDQLLREVNTRGSSWCHIGYKSPSGGQRGMYSPYYESWRKSDRNWKYLS